MSGGIAIVPMHYGLTNNGILLVLKSAGNNNVKNLYSNFPNLNGFIMG